MRHASFLLALTLLACGGTAVVDGDDGSGGTATGTQTGTATGTQTGTATGTQTGTATGTQTGTGTGTQTGLPEGAYFPEILSTQFFADCMPVIPPDPMGGTVDIAWKNGSDGPASATIVSATLTGLAQTTLQTTFDLEPSVVTGAASQLMTTHNKVAGSATGDDGCAFCGADEITLALVVQIGTGEAVVVEAPATFGCAF